MSAMVNARCSVNYFYSLACSAHNFRPQKSKIQTSSKPQNLTHSTSRFFENFSWNCLHSTLKFKVGTLVKLLYNLCALSLWSFCHWPQNFWVRSPKSEASAHALLTNLPNSRTFWKTFEFHAYLHSSLFVTFSETRSLSLSLTDRAQSRHSHQAAHRFSIKNSPIFDYNFRLNLGV